MAIPVVYIWSGIFPANLKSDVLGVLFGYALLSSIVKYYVRPGRNVLHDVRYGLDMSCAQQLLLVKLPNTCLV